MHSVTERGDLTARARIRNAAIDLFGQHGVAATSVRAIAHEAGVSPALVMHHFGNKDGLRKACDAHVIRLFTDGSWVPEEDERQSEDCGGVEALTIEAIQAALNDLDSYGPALDYLRRILSEDSEIAHTLFDGFMATTLAGLEAQIAAGMVLPQEDLEATAALLVVFGMAPFVLDAPFARALGSSHVDGAVLERITLPTLEMFTHGLYNDDSILEATRGAMGTSHAEQKDSEG